MIVDTSALVAILAGETEAARFKTVLAEAGNISVSAGSWVEFATVLVRKYGVRDPARVLDTVMAAYRLTIVPVTPRQTVIATAAYTEFGRGSDHPARLNFGDCFAYALAKEMAEPLLFKGNDFNQTDIESAI